MHVAYSRPLPLSAAVVSSWPLQRDGMRQLHPQFSIKPDRFFPMTNNRVMETCAEGKMLSFPTERINHRCTGLFRNIPDFPYWKGSSFSIGGRFERFEKMLESSSILVKSSTMSVQIVKVTDFFQKYIYIYIFSVEKSEHFY